MNFLEKLFGLTPDAGTGSTEALLVIVLFVIASLISRRLATAARNGRR